uniref:Uncharacterized protein n=1 Tax=Meloidogyne javanica TaxID=6303 RepID=A0A915MLZ3_MELJA
MSRYYQDGQNATVTGDMADMDMVCGGMGGGCCQCGMCGGGGYSGGYGMGGGCGSCGGAGANLDLNVVVLVQKSFVREGCHDLLLLDDCIKRKCTQNVLYKVDLGYSKVRRSAEGTLTNYSQSMVRRNNEMLEEIAIKNSQMQNDAFQPFLYSEFKRLIELFYNGNKRIFALFNISMEELINEKLEIVEKNNYCDNKLLPEFE